jgi:hypothetical protein
MRLDRARFSVATFGERSVAALVEVFMIN